MQRQGTMHPLSFQVIGRVNSGHSLKSAGVLKQHSERFALIRHSAALCLPNPPKMSTKYCHAHLNGRPKHTSHTISEFTSRQHITRCKTESLMTHSKVIACTVSTCINGYICINSGHRNCAPDRINSNKSCWYQHISFSVRYMQSAYLPATSDISLSILL